MDGDLRKAAALLANSGSLLLGGLCESCSQILQERLAIISSGGSLDVLRPNENPIRTASDVTESNFADKVQAAQQTFLSGLDNTDGRISFGNPLLASEDGSGQGVDSEPYEKGGNALKQEAKVEKKLDDTLAPVSGHLASELNDVVAKMASHSLGGTTPSRTGKVESVKKKIFIETAGQILRLPSNTSEHARVMQVTRKKDFVSYERVNGNLVNVVEGLELHTNVFNETEHEELVNFIYHLQELGRNQKLRRRTYSEPRKWMRGKGRITIQFGCCYNYATDKDGNPPGIIQDEEVDDIPQMLKMVIKRLVKWHVLPCNSVPDSCIVNIYDVGDCIPSHIDHHDFVRPFCTLSLLSECDIVFGSNLKIVGPGTFKGSISIPLPVGSVLVLNGNGADVAKHAVPSVPMRRISITFRKMDPSKVPEGFTPDPDLVGTQPLKYTTQAVSKMQNPQLQAVKASHVSHLEIAGVQNGTSELPHFVLESDFPPLQVSEPGRKREKSKF